MKKLFLITACCGVPVVSIFMAFAIIVADIAHRIVTNPSIEQ